jgi:membrane protease subunit HflK
MARRGWGDGPIDIEAQVADFRVPKPPSPATLRLFAIVLGVLFLLITGYYQIEPDEVGVVQRFGAHVRTTDPGPHFKLPWPIETVRKVPVQRQLNMEFGFRSLRSTGGRTQYATSDAEADAEALMLTGDLNVANVEWIVQFRISDPVKFLFKVRDPELTFRYMSEAAMRKVVGDHSVDEVITVGREEIARLAKEELQTLCDRYEIGIDVQQLVLQDVNPPDPVKPAFNEVNQAIQEKERATNEAWADYNKEVPRAKGEAEQLVRAAEGYATERVNRAEGDAKRFESMYEEYRKAPQVTKRRLYLEAMGRIAPKLGQQVVVDEQAKSVLPFLQLGAAGKEKQQ